MNSAEVKYKWIFFDLDNTLMDFKGASHQSVRDLVENTGRTYSEEIYDRYHFHNMEVWHAFERNEISALELRWKRFELFLNEMGWKEDPKNWGKKYLEGLVNYSTLLDQASEILEYTRKKYNLLVVTNGLREVQRPRLRKCGIYETFDGIVVSDEIGHSKPDYEFFQHCFNIIGDHDKSEILMIGDSLTSDIRGAEIAGLDSCWYDIHGLSDSVHQKPKMTFQINALSDLFEIL